MLRVFLLEIWFRNLASLYIFRKENKKSPCFLLLTGQNKQVIRSIKGALSGLRQFLATESPLKLMKNAYFTSKALFVLKIFKFLS